LTTSELAALLSSEIVDVLVKDKQANGIMLAIEHQEKMM